MIDERRAAARIPALAPIEVTDTITGDSLGSVGNLSRNGVMLICIHPLRDDAIYQLKLSMPDRGETMEIGVHTMWTQHAATGAYQWSGHRIISISGEAAKLLDHWIRLDAS